jgi:hypothetical protein
MIPVNAGQGSNPRRTNLLDDLTEQVTESVHFEPLTDAVVLNCGHSLNESTAIELSKDPSKYICPECRAPITDYRASITLRQVAERVALSPAESVNQQQIEESESLYKQGRALCDQGLQEEGVSVLLKALELNPDYEKAQAYLEFVTDTTRHARRSSLTFVPPQPIASAPLQDKDEKKPTPSIYPDLSNLKSSLPDDGQPWVAIPQKMPPVPALHGQPAIEAEPAVIKPIADAEEQQPASTLTSSIVGLAWQGFQSVANWVSRAPEEESSEMQPREASPPQARDASMLGTRRNAESSQSPKPTESKPKNESQELIAQIAYLTAENVYTHQQVAQYREQLKHYSPTIEQDALESTSECGRLEHEVEVLKEDPSRESEVKKLQPSLLRQQQQSYQKRTEAYEYELLQKRLAAALTKIAVYEELKKRLAEIEKNAK